MNSSNSKRSTFFAKLVERAAPRGIVSQEELRAALPSGEATSVEIDRLIFELRERGIVLVETQLPPDCNHESAVRHLFEQTLSGDYNDDAPWRAVGDLQIVGTRAVFETASAWLLSREPLRRARGADVLAQLGVTVGKRHAFPQESYVALMELLRVEKETRPIASAISALGHVGNTDAASLIATFTNHNDPKVRFAVAFGIGRLRTSPLVIGPLLALMRDVDEDIRDWATFELGVLASFDTQEIRDALVERLDDSFENARLEAIEALAKRKDMRVLSALLAELELHDEPNPPSPIISAAWLLLGIEDDENDLPDWTTAEYAAALRERYPHA